MDVNYIVTVQARIHSLLHHVSQLPSHVHLGRCFLHPLLIHQMAVFEKLTDLFSATYESLITTLFPSPSLPPFTSFTVLILEILLSAFHSSNSSFNVTKKLSLSTLDSDPDADAFASGSGGSVVAGFLLCFPNYTSFMAKPGIYIEDIYVREAWRRKGMGKMMLMAVAGQAKKMGVWQVDRCVLDWNGNAIKFYKEMGVDFMPMWRICRLFGESLEKHSEDCEDDTKN